MAIGIKYDNDKKVFIEVEGSVPFLKFSLFEDTGIVKHGFSTKLGGVSKGYYSSMNLSFTRGDNEDDVRENFRIMADAVGVKTEDMVFTHQTHTTNVRVVTKEDRGNGITRERNFFDTDGLVTNDENVCLVTFFADCVPLFFLDPVKKVIGLSHSGWRGTVGKIGMETVRVMKEEFGCDPNDILAAVGPSICQDCYEVSKDVIDKFKENFDEKYWDELFYEKDNGKYQLNLWKANEIVFLESGITKDHIAISNICTHCNSDIFYSHRTTGDKRGNMCGFLSLK